MVRGENPQYERTPLGRYEGQELYTAPEALVKGVLEAESAASLIVGPATDGFATLFRIARDEAAAHVLREHELQVKAVPTASRAVALALEASRAAAVALAIVPNRELDRTTEQLAAMAAERPPPGGGLCVLLEDRPADCPASDPRRLARELDLPTFEPRDVAELRAWAELAPRTAQAACRPVALVVHESIMKGGQTLNAHPNRVAESVDAMLARRRRKRRPRLGDAEGILRMVRKLELNTGRCLPSPGERVPLGFVTTGPADAVLDHVFHASGLVGRVPVLHLGVLHPLDKSAVGRFLERCERVLVIEPRAGAVEPGLLSIAESMRAAGQRPAIVEGLPAVGGDSVGMKPGDAVHPSGLAARVVPILQRHHSGVHGTGFRAAEPEGRLTLPRGTTIGARAARRHLRRVATEVDEQLRAAAPAGEAPARAIVVDGRRSTAEAGQYVMLETWEAAAFERDGIAAMRQAARDDRVGVLLIYAGDPERSQDLVRLVRAAVPAARADRVVIESANFVDGEELHERCRTAAQGAGLTVIIVQDGPPARYDVKAIERSFADIDRLGFEPLQHVISSLDRACAVRQPVEDEGPDPDAGKDHPAMRTELRISAREGRPDRGVRVRVRPLLEQVDVLRTRPPVQSWRRGGRSRPPLPEILHRQAGRWRMHVAGMRGDGPGLVGRILCRAGVRMGYAVRVQHDDTPVGPGRRAWAQLLFTRPRATETMPPHTARIPVGEADVLLGLDAAETVRALAADETLRVAAPGHTYIVANTGFRTDETETEAATVLREQLRALAAENAHAHPRLLEDFAEACRMSFLTDRIADLALLGAAFQMGLVPVTLDILEAVVADVEPTRYGRLLEAFRFGRRLAIERPLFSRPKDDRSEDVSRIVRRASHLLSRRRGGATNHERAVQLLRTSVEAMPGLTETESGRWAQRDFVIGLNRCRLWGGLEYAEQYARLITTLYRVDRAETARSLTRNAVLPLAGAMLVRDVIYVASVATSAEHRRRLRQRMNVKRARADSVERRYLTRIELHFFGREVRADVRTSDWPARLVTAARRFVPRGWRGTPRERALRSTIIELVERATHDPPDCYEGHVAAFAQLHAAAVDNRLRLLEPEAVRVLFDEPTDPAGLTDTTDSEDLAEDLDLV